MHHTKTVKYIKNGNTSIVFMMVFSFIVGFSLGKLLDKEKCS